MADLFHASSFVTRIARRRKSSKTRRRFRPAVENDYADLIRSLIETYRLADEPFTIEPTPEALEAMNAHYNAIVKRRRG